MRLLPSAVASSVAVGLLLAGCGSTVHYTGFVRTPTPRVGALSLPDVSKGGKPFTFRAMPRGLLLVYFGYTLCPDVCPTTLSDLGTAVRRLGADEQERIGVAVVTVDPKRDTTPILGKYVRAFFPAGHGLRTTDDRRLSAVAGRFGAAYKVVKARDGAIDVIHTAFVYAVDAAGHVRLQWSFGTKSDAFRSDLHALLRAVG